MIEIAQHPADCYIWQAIYQDDTVIGEYDTLEGRGFADVARDRVKSLLLLGDAAAHVVAVPPGATPVFFRRRRVTLELVGEQQLWNTAHCIGWENEQGASYLFVFEDGSTLLTSDFQAV